MSNETTRGYRVPDGGKWYGEDGAAGPGAYGRVKVDGAWEWRCCTPTGLGGNLSAHDVVEHEDGTITVSPSILVTQPDGTDKPLAWHGYLERGVWRSV